MIQYENVYLIYLLFECTYSLMIKKLKLYNFGTIKVFRTYYHNNKQFKRKIQAGLVT